MASRRSKKPKRSFDDFLSADPIFGPMMKEIEDVFGLFNTSSEGVEWISSSPVIHGYSITMGPDGNPVVKEFGNVRYPVKESPPQIAEQSEPLTDVIDGKYEVRVIVELPGVSKDDIRLSVNGTKLAIDVASHGRKYRKSVDLPSAKYGEPVMTYINGILEVRLAKASERR